MPKNDSNNNKYTCQINGCDLRGDPIPEESREWYGKDTTHFSRKLGLEVQGYYDGVSFYECPDCKGMWCRFTGKPVKDVKDGTSRKLGRPGCT